MSGWQLCAGKKEGTYEGDGMEMQGLVPRENGRQSGGKFSEKPEYAIGHKRMAGGTGGVHVRVDMCPERGSPYKGGL